MTEGAPKPTETHSREFSEKENEIIFAVVKTMKDKFDHQGKEKNKEEIKALLLEMLATYDIAPLPDPLQEQIRILDMKVEIFNILNEYKEEKRGKITDEVEVTKRIGEVKNMGGISERSDDESKPWYRRGNME